jgi:hypothetical protein
MPKFQNRNSQVFELKLTASFLFGFVQASFRHLGGRTDTRFFYEIWGEILAGSRKPVSA